MTVANETAYRELPWTGVETSYNTQISVEAGEQIRVNYRNAANAVALLAAGIHYFVTVDPDTAIATVFPMSMPAAPGMLLIERVTTAVQPTDFDDLEDYSAQVHETLFDRIYRIAAELRRDVDQTLARDPSNLFFDGQNAEIKNVAPGSGATSVATVGQIESLIGSVAIGPAGPAGNNLFTSLAQSIKTLDYSVILSDRGTMVIANSAVPIAFLLPAQATMANSVFFFGNIGQGPLTITPTGGAIDGMPNLILATGDKAIIVGSGATAYAFYVPAAGGGAETAIASAALTAIGGVATQRVEVTGNAAITSFGTASNRLRIVRYSGAPTVTHGVNLILLIGANRAPKPGSVGFYASDAAGTVWRELAYAEGDGGATFNEFRFPGHLNTRIYAVGNTMVFDANGTTVMQIGATGVDIDQGLDVAGPFTMGGAWYQDGYVAPTTITVSPQPNYALPAVGSIIALTSTVPISFSGLLAPTQHRRVWLWNMNALGGATLTLQEENAGSLAANRINSGGDGDVLLAPQKGAEFVYHVAGARWRVARELDMATAAQIWARTAGKVMTAAVYSQSLDYVALSFGATVTVSFDAGTNFQLGFDVGNAITANFAFGDPAGNSEGVNKGKSGVIMIKNGTPFRQITAFHTNWVYPGGVKPSLTQTAGRIDELYYTIRPDGLVSVAQQRDTRNP